MGWLQFVIHAGRCDKSKGEQHIIESVTSGLVVSDIIDTNMFSLVKLVGILWGNLLQLQLIFQQTCW